MSTMFAIAWITWVVIVLALFGVLAWGLGTARCEPSPVRRLRHARQQRLARGQAWRRDVREEP